MTQQPNGKPRRYLPLEEMDGYVPPQQLNQNKPRPHLPLEEMADYVPPPQTISTEGPIWRQYRTLGEYENEKKSEERFDELAELSGLFKPILKEVCGRYAFTPPEAQGRTAKLDRVLFPSAKLKAAGWVHGPIGIEFKKSEVKIGNPLAQLKTYKEVLWRVEPGYHMMFEWCFLWPSEKIECDLGSVTTQDRIGTCRESPGWSLVFQCAAKTLIGWRQAGHFKPTDEEIVKSGQCKIGQRRGSL